MTTSVPTSEYRANMRHWHDRARAGDDVIVTEHGVPSVRVSAPRSESVLDRLERQGLLRRGRPRRPASEIESVPVAFGDSADTISRDRDRQQR